MVSLPDLNAFLWCCYAPRFDASALAAITEDVREFASRRKAYANSGDPDLIRTGRKILDGVFADCLSSISGLQVVPLSGGLDSRLILAYLLDAGLGSQTIAVTYGTPGTLDYELAKEVTKAADVRHEVVDLSALLLDEHSLCENAKLGAAWTNLISSYYNRMWRDLVGEATYWSGYLGDPIAGSHFKPSFLKLDFAQSKRVFATFNRWTRADGITLTHPDFDLIRVLPSEPLIDDPGLVTFPEQLDFCIRQASWIRRSQIEPFDSVMSPFTSPEWMRFMLAVPDRARVGCRLYQQLMVERFPKLFSIRSKTVFGGTIATRGRAKARWLMERAIRRARRQIGLGNPLDPYLNYLDFEGAYRDRADFRALAEGAIDQIAVWEVVPWIDCRAILRDHLEGNADRSRELDVLISLAISLRAQRCAQTFKNSSPNVPYARPMGPQLSPAAGLGSDK